MLPTIWGIYVSWLNICLYWIYHANTWGMNVIWRVSLCPSSTGWKINIFWDYISCTYNLGDINYLNIIAGIGYKEPTMGGGDIYLLGLYVSCTCSADKHI